MGEYIPEAERAEMERLAAEREDAPIEDLEARAKAVAKELRKRGNWARTYWDGSKTHVIGAVGGHYYSVEPHANLGPRAIADLIQAEEAQRAQKWAGDL
jgi:hypothetical protein